MTGCSVDYSNDFVQSTVNRSKNLKCSGCNKALPIETRVVFELRYGTFRGAFCMDCFNNDSQMQTAFYDQRHLMDLEE